MAWSRGQKTPRRKKQKKTGPFSEQTFQTGSARNGDRVIQLLDGRMPTCPLCCFSLAAYKDARTNTSPLVLGLAWQHTTPPPLLPPLYVLAASNKKRGRGTESQTWPKRQHCALPLCSLFTLSALLRHSFVLFPGIFWDTVLIMGWWD